MTVGSVVALFIVVLACGALGAILYVAQRSSKPDVHQKHEEEMGKLIEQFVDRGMTWSSAHFLASEILQKRSKKVEAEIRDELKRKAEAEEEVGL